MPLHIFEDGRYIYTKAKEEEPVGNCTCRGKGW